MKMGTSVKNDLKISVIALILGLSSMLACNEPKTERIPAELDTEIAEIIEDCKELQLEVLNPIIMVNETVMMRDLIYADEDLFGLDYEIISGHAEFLLGLSLRASAPGMIAIRLTDKNSCSSLVKIEAVQPVVISLNESPSQNYFPEPIGLVYYGKLQFKASGGKGPYRFVAESAEVDDFYLDSDTGLFRAGETTGKVEIYAEDASSQRVLAARVNIYIESGKLDLSFGENAFSSFQDGFSAIQQAMSPDGQYFYVLGSYREPGNFSEQGIALAKWKIDGSLVLDAFIDSSANGLMLIPALLKSSRIIDMQVQSDGKILIFTIDSVISSSPRPLLIRLLADGSFDPEFGNSGTVEASLRYSSFGYKFRLQSDGKILVMGRGRSEQLSDLNFVIQRFLSNGEPDSSFGNEQGIVTLPAELKSADALLIDEETNSRFIWVLGNVSDVETASDPTRSYSRPLISRLLDTGKFDSDFGTDGNLKIEICSRDSRCQTIERHQYGTSLLKTEDGRIWLGLLDGGSHLLTPIFSTTSFENHWTILHPGKWQFYYDPQVNPLYNRSDIVGRGFQAMEAGPNHFYIICHLCSSDKLFPHFYLTDVTKTFTANSQLDFNKNIMQLNLMRALGLEYDPWWTIYDSSVRPLMLADGRIIISAGKGLIRFWGMESR